MKTGKETDSDIEARVLFINDDIIVVNKRAGEAMEGAGRGMINLSKLLGERYGTKGKNEVFAPTAVHRLDVPVSGCALFARTPNALAFLNNVFSRNVYQGGRAEKYYWAVVEKSKEAGNLAGKPVETGELAEIGELAETGELIHWIQTNTKKNKSSAYDKKTAIRKEGILRYRIKGIGENYIFIEIELVTGRHHQIRAQLAALGLHIKGDLKYGAARSEKNGGIRLHARSLYFPDPSVQGNFIQVTADPPVMDRLWENFALS
jgi:23S rRNA pseudouridine1911/1915/1917 synthase